MWIAPAFRGGQSGQGNLLVPLFPNLIQEGVGWAIRYAMGGSRLNMEHAVRRVIQPMFRLDATEVKGRDSLIEEKARIERLDVRSELALQIVMAYLDVLFAKDNLKRVRHEREAVQRERVRIEGRYAFGKASRVELEYAKASGERLEAVLVQARDMLQVRQANLERLVGSHVNRLKRLIGELQRLRVEPMDAKFWEERALRSNLKVRAAMLGVEIARREAVIQRAEQFPVAGWEATCDSEKTSEYVLGGGSRIGTRGVGLVPKVSLMPGGSVLAEIREAQAKVQQAELKLEQARRQARQEVREALAGVSKGLARLRAFKRSMRSRERFLNALEQGVRSGLNTSMEVLDARRDLFNVRRDFAMARYDYVSSCFRLKRAVGELDCMAASFPKGGHL